MVTTALQKNDEIRKNIFDSFYWDARVDNYSNINIEIFNGRVTLIGSVPNPVSRLHAEKDALAVPGVTSVDNRLKIKFNDAVKIPSDREIEERIRSIIQWNSGIPVGDLAVSVNGGFATIDGTVCSYYLKFRAQELVADVIGVTRIENNLKVVPAQKPADRDIASAVMASVKSRLGTDAGSLTVMVDGGIVTLTGTVPDAFALLTAENAARTVRGMVDLHNLLAIKK